MWTATVYTRDVVSGERLAWSFTGERWECCIWLFGVSAVETTYTLLRA